MHLPPPPDWLARIPLIGARITDAWIRFSASNVSELGSRLAPYAGSTARWFATAAGSVGGMLLHFVLTTAIAAVMYSGGEKAAAAAIRFGHRLGGDRGEMAIVLAGKAIRGVALGVTVTAVAQSALGGIGLLAAGMPYAGMLTALMFMLCLVQIGPALVLVPAVIWLYYTGETLRGTVLLAFTVLAMALDGILRPFLIKKRRGPAAAAHFGGRYRRAGGIRHSRHLPRSCYSCDRLLLAGCLDGRSADIERDRTPSSARCRSLSPTWVRADAICFGSAVMQDLGRPPPAARPNLGDATSS